MTWQAMINNVYQKMYIFIRQYIVELIILLIGIIVMSFIKTVPYLNLLLIRPEIEFFLVFVLIMVLFSPRVKHTILFIIITVFSLLALFSLAQSKFLIEQMGNVLYAFLVIGFIQFLISLRKK